MSIVNKEKYQKLVICDYRSKLDYHFGGSPPRGVVPSLTNKYTKYLLSFPLDESNDASVFVSFQNEDYESPFYLFGEDDVLHQAGSSLIEIVVHKKQRDFTDITDWGKLPEAGMEVNGAGRDPGLIGDELPDPYDCYDIHKVGGYPFFSNADEELLDSVFDSYKTGYELALQLTFPTADDIAIDCDWPFGEASLCIYTKLSDDGCWLWKAAWA